MVVNPACLSWGGLGAVNTGSDVWISFIITSPSYKNPVLYLLLKAEVSDPVVLANAAFQAGFWNRKVQLQVTTYDFVAFQATHSCFSDLFYLWNPWSRTRSNWYDFTCWKNTSYGLPWTHHNSPRPNVPTFTRIPWLHTQPRSEERRVGKECRL